MTRPLSGHVIHDDGLQLLAGCVVALIVVGLVLWGMCVAGIRATERDREWRAARAAACRTIEDETLRTLCLVKAP